MFSNRFRLSFAGVLACTFNVQGLDMVHMELAKLFDSMGSSWSLLNGSKTSKESWNFGDA